MKFAREIPVPSQSPTPVTWDGSGPHIQVPPSCLACSHGPRRESAREEGCFCSSFKDFWTLLLQSQALTEQRFLYPYPSMVLGFPTVTSMEACRLLPNPDASPKNGKPLERPLLNRGFHHLKIHIGCPAWWRMPIVTVHWKAEARGWLELWLELQANLETGTM